METREMRYFVAVAEELNFGRAAERLGMAQPPLSRAIQQLERRLGTKLLERDRRAVELTPAGAVLLREARTALTAVEAAERRTRRAGVQPDGITLVAKTGMGSERLAKLLDAFAVEHPDVKVDVVLAALGESEPMLHDGRADLGLLTLPFDRTTGLDYEELDTENRVAILPGGHPYGIREGITLAEMDTVPGLPQARWRQADGTYPDGPGPQIRDQLQLLQLVSLGRASAVICESCLPTAAGLASVPVTDAAPVTNVIAWPAHSRSQTVAALVRTALSR
ncbi:LysR family transcriptional regulator [Kineosporia sp. NBRC 101677]|uniref:LysR family transcriptional regulator n=1 Tax=Kineosporia sp. NBRC 101677 TaxID=3032197 RepID=UPI0024A56FA6|nr:LysR family transcriptional regulator [Kineosporia sp. NBRC 101677]GLY15466.1 LysR family transcriptional regulator [Kineosporia sp. NBRC 101677]